jgi:hypothetical protein
METKRKAMSKKPNHVETDGILYLSPYSGIAEIINETGLSVFWCESKLVPKLLPFVGTRVKATYNNGIEATRRVMSLNRPDDLVQLVSIKPMEAAREVPAVMTETWSIIGPTLLCSLLECRHYAAKNSAYCETHTKEIKGEPDGQETR